MPMRAFLGAGLAIVLAASVSYAQVKADPKPAADATALTSQVETTTARRLLMVSIGGNNDALHDMLDGVIPWDGSVFQARLESMAAMMRAFPSLFRAEPNPWTEEAEAADPARVSLSLPNVWEEWDLFVAKSEEATQTMLRAARAPRADALAPVEELEAQCESCHEQFRKSFDYLDYDAVLGPVE